MSSGRRRLSWYVNIEYATFFARTRSYAARCGQHPAQAIGDLVARGHRRDIGGGALQHRHVLGRRRHRRHEGDGGRAAADDDDALARVVEVGRPVLRVHQRPREVSAPAMAGV